MLRFKNKVALIVQLGQPDSPHAAALQTLATSLVGRCQGNLRDVFCLSTIPPLAPFKFTRLLNAHFLPYSTRSAHCPRHCASYSCFLSKMETIKAVFFKPDPQAQVSNSYLYLSVADKMKLTLLFRSANAIPLFERILANSIAISRT